MPSSGGAAVAQIFHWLEGWEQPRRRTNYQPREMSAETLHRFVDAQNAAFADRNLYSADADFAEVPEAGMVDKRYIAARREELSRFVSAVPAPLAAGVPEGVGAVQYATSPPTAENGTTHFSVADRDGTLVAFTSEPIIQSITALLPSPADAPSLCCSQRRSRRIGARESSCRSVASS